MNGLPQHVTSRPVVDLLVRAVEIVVVSLLIFVGLPLLAAHAA